MSRTAALPASARTGPRDALARWRLRAPGLAAAAALACAAGWIAGGLGDPLARNPVLVAMVFGLALGAALGCPDTLRPGLDYAKRTLLRLGVALLGLRISVALLADLGAVPVAIAAAELAIVLVSVRWVARRVLRLDGELALLVAVGSAVCGAAAILSFAAQDKARERHAGPAIGLITIAGTLALLAYPVAYLGGWLPLLDERGFGIAVGSSIFELAQVYGASCSVSEGALEVATLVKLSKVVMLIPLLVAFGDWRRGGAKAGPRTLPIPWFVVGFLAVMLLNSAVTLHPVLRQSLLSFDQFLFLMVTVALGLTTPLGRLRDATGAWRLLAAGAFALAVSTGTAVALTAALAVGRAPATPGAIAAPASRGALLFEDTGCAKCHVPALQGVRGPVPLYSDLLLHDMGPALDDKIVQGEATGADWRTTPLVGLHTHSRYLHDGRAETLRDAILAHGGEAEIVRRRFFELDEPDQAEVIRFLGTL